ncbi:MAG: hypothetical protein HQK63_17200 [Desulfamplus sp.]|nr:hypothetical protein [Desulfamplus sp.]
MVEVIKRKKSTPAEPVIEIKGDSTKSAEVETKPTNPEVKPPPQPKPPKQPKPQQPQQVKEDSSKKQFFFLRIGTGTDEESGERLMFRMRSGEIVEGVIVDEKSGFVKLADVVIIDKELGTISKVRWIRMERTQIAHFSPLPTEIKKIEPKGE